MNTGSTDMDTGVGRSPADAGSGSRRSGRAASAGVSPPDGASIPNAMVRYCSFCGKSEHEVLCLVAGPVHIFICDEDVQICADIVLEHRVKKAMREALASAIEARSDATGTGAAEGESAVAESQTPDTPPVSQ